MFLSVFAHNTFHYMSNIWHAVFRCLKLSLSQISEENTVNYKPWYFIHCVWLQWAFKWPISLSPAAIWIFVPPLNSLGFVNLWRCKTYWRRDCGLIGNFSMFGYLWSFQQQQKPIACCRSTEGDWWQKHPERRSHMFVDFWEAFFLGLHLLNIWVRKPCKNLDATTNFSNHRISK